MKDLRTKRIELLEQLQELVTKNIITDRPQITSRVRRENRQLKRMVKELAQWKDELYDQE